MTLRIFMIRFSKFGQSSGHKSRCFFFLRFFFLTTIFKVFIEFVTIVLPFYVLGVLASRHVES